MLNSVDAAPLIQPPVDRADQKVGYAAKIVEYQSELRQMLVAETKKFKSGKSSSILLLLRQLNISIMPHSWHMGDRRTF